MDYGSEDPTGGMDTEQTGVDTSLDGDEGGLGGLDSGLDSGGFDTGALDSSDLDPGGLDAGNLDVPDLDSDLDSGSELPSAGGGLDISINLGDGTITLDSAGTAPAGDDWLDPDMSDTAPTDAPSGSGGESPDKGESSVDVGDTETDESSDPSTDTSTEESTDEGTGASAPTDSGSDAESDSGAEDLITAETNYGAVEVEATEDTTGDGIMDTGTTDVGPYDVELTDSDQDGSADAGIVYDDEGNVVQTAEIDPVTGEWLDTTDTSQADSGDSDSAEPASDESSEESSDSSAESAESEESSDSADEAAAVEESDSTEESEDK